MNYGIEEGARQGALFQSHQDQRATRGNHQEEETASSSTDLGDRRPSSRFRIQKSAENVLPDVKPEGTGRATCQPPGTRCGENCSKCQDRPCSGMREHDGEHFCDNCGDESNKAKNKGEHDEGDPDCAEDSDDVGNPVCCGLRPLLRAANPPSKDEAELEPSREEVAATLTALYRALLEEKKTHPAPTLKREERQEAKKQEKEERKSRNKTNDKGNYGQPPSEACPDYMRVLSECREPTLKFALLEAPTSQSSSSLCQCMYMLAAFKSQERVTAAVKKEICGPFLPPCPLRMKHGTRKQD